MEKWNVLGYKHVEFDTADGKHIAGTNLYLCRDRDGVIGSECCKLFISDGKLGRAEKEIPIGYNVEISYNRYGKPESITFNS